MKIKIINIESQQEFTTDEEFQSILHRFNTIKQVHATAIKKVWTNHDGTYVQDKSGTTAHIPADEFTVEILDVAPMSKPATKAPVAKKK